MEDFDFYPQKPELIESKINRKTSLTFFSMLLFALGLVLIGSTDFLFIFFVILVLFVHEIGHFSFMKIYQYKNVRMLFVPLMGAFVQGKKESYQEKQSFFVIMAGPIPGVLLGTILLYLGEVLNYNWMKELSILFLFINMINLLPLDMLDGGQMLKLFFNKNEGRFQVIMSFVSSLLMIMIGWYFSLTFLIVFGFLMGLRVRSAQKKYQIQKECEGENINYKTTYQALSNKDFSKLKEIVLEYTPALRKYLDNEEEEITNPLLAEHVNNALVAPIDRNASSLFKFIVILVWIVSFLLPIVLAYNINSLKF
jgi:ABC-type multidrug transport system fused ATPase/permease subunit